MTTDEMMAHAVACIRRGKFESGDIEVINGLLALDCGPELVSRAVQPRDYDCAKSTMTSLEALAEKSPASALGLMIHLMSIIDEMDTHDIWDAILLWLEHCKSPEILNYLDHWIAIETNEEVREDLLYIKKNCFAD